MNVCPQRRLTVAFLASGMVAVALFVGWRMIPGNRLGARINDLLDSPTEGTFLNYHLPRQATDELRTMGTNAIPWLLRNLDDVSGPPRLHGLLTEPWIPNRIRSRYWEHVQRRHDRARAVADAFGALGPAAAGAVPELMQRVGRPHSAQQAAFCLKAIRPSPTNVVTDLLVYLKSTNAEVRNAASSALLWIAPDAATRAGLQ